MSSENNRDRHPGRNGSRSLLVVAHPGHELRVHGWLESARPIVCVVTDGSGRTNHSRLDSTTRVLASAGCFTGPIYGRMTDQNLYASVMDFDLRRFLDLIDELASLLISNEIDYVTGDAEEGYNPAHDICRIVINAAVDIANGSGREIKNFDFNLIGPPGDCPVPLHARAIHLQLDADALARKLTAAQNYPELQAEVAAAFSGAGSVGLQQHLDLANHITTAGVIAAGTEQFSVECLRPVNGERISQFGPTPFYEVYGERQVAAGHYTRVLRYSEHVLPLIKAVKSHVRRLSQV